MFFLHNIILGGKDHEHAQISGGEYAVIACEFFYDIIRAILPQTDHF